MTRRIAVVGIDGCGKSTLIRRFLELAPVPEQEVQVITCPLYHETPNAPLGELSRQLDLFSQAADALGSYELKAAALYLQMTLFGPVEKAIGEAFEPTYFLCERHALVDSLAYGPLYGRVVRGAVDGSVWEDRLSAELEARRPGSYPAIRRWFARENRRLGLTASFWDLPLNIREIFASSGSVQIEELGRRYRTALPDVVLLLDVPGEVAQERVAARSAGTGELHEEAAMLEMLRWSYHNVARTLRKEHPQIAVHVIDTGSDRSVDETLREVLKHAEIAVPELILARVDRERTA